MGWIYDLIIYAILFLIFAVRKEKGKRRKLYNNSGHLEERMV